MPKRSTSSTPDAWRQLLTHYIAEHPQRPLKARALARELGVPDHQYDDFRELVRTLLADGQIVLGPGRTLALPSLSGKIVGVFRRHRQGFGFIEAPGRPDLYVSRIHAGDALDGDVVAARMLAGRPGDDRSRGEIVRVVERGQQRWVGVLERIGRAWGVRPQGKAHAPLVTIADPTAKSAQPGDLVVVEPLGRVEDADTVRGVIVEKLGPPGETLVKVLGVVRRFGLPDRFPGPVRDEATAAVAAFNPADLSGREDLTGLLTLTIDPDDARDFDDAISIERLAHGQTRLGVHVADASHFVPIGGALDTEARLRGNSVYFPGHVVPMLPEVLSNGVCSLQPDQPRFVKSVFITYDGHARVKETRFANAVIRSRARLTYDQATAALEGRAADMDPVVLHALRDAERLARAIRQRRLAVGMISLALPEVEIRLGRDGRVADAGAADTSFSHTLIEMCMVEANEAVCRRLTEAGLPHLRRVHAEPEPDSSSLAPLRVVLGPRLPRVLNRQSIQALIDEVRGKPEEFAANYALLRSLPQAVYAPNEGEHFALASEAYSHFTSPIRRYPDLVNHRALQRLFEPGAGGRRRRGRELADDDKSLAELAAHTSATERRAQQAERECRQLLMLEFMRQHIGAEFDGVVTGTASFGAFVQTRPHMAEGLIRVEELGPGDWRFDTHLAALVSRRLGRVLAIGQPLRVIVAAVDDARLEMSLRPADRQKLGAPYTAGLTDAAPPSAGQRRRGRGRDHGRQSDAGGRGQARKGHVGRAKRGGKPGRRGR